MLIVVNVEWPSGSEEVEFEMDEGSTPEEIEDAARDAFFSTCNYGFSIDGVQQ